MPSDIANKIVKQIFGDEKAAAIDSMNDALSAATYDAIQQQKINFAKQMGFELDDTAQDAADEIAADLATDDAEPETVEVDGRKPEDPPADEVEQPTAEQEPEEQTDETDKLKKSIMSIFSAKRMKAKRITSLKVSFCKRN